jgi:hypothetical protein
MSKQVKVVDPRSSPEAAASKRNWAENKRRHPNAKRYARSWGWWYKQCSGSTSYAAIGRRVGMSSSALASN